MKLNGMAGKGSGKLGSHVYATVRGEQIVRQYNSVVFNPNTEKQVKVRQKFVLLTKLGTQLKDALMFQNKKALQSNRNMFIKVNYGTYDDEANNINWNGLKLNSSVVEAGAYPTVTSVEGGRAIQIQQDGSSQMFAGFGWAVILVTNDENGDVWVMSGIASSAGGTTATATVNLPQGGNYSEAYLLGYPMWFKDGAARVRYQNELYGFNDTTTVLISAFYNRMQAAGDIVVYDTKPLDKTPAGN